MQQGGLKQKSTYEVWQRWAKVLKRQLDLAADVYAEHKQGDKQKRTKALSDRIELFIDPVAHAADLAERNFDVRGSVVKLYLLALANLQGLFREALEVLPCISEDMQALLQSPCYGSCRGRVASDIFKGPHGTQNEGIAAGVVDERGGLPWVLNKMLDEADIGGEEYFHKGLNMGNTPGEGEDDHGGHAGGGAGRHGFAPPRKKITATGVQ